MSAAPNPLSSQCSSPTPSPSLMRSVCSPQQTPGQKKRIPMRTRVTAIIESSGMRCSQPTSPPNTAPLAKRVITPLEPCHVQTVLSGRCEEELRKTISVPTVNQLHTASDLTRKSELEVGLNRSGQADPVYQHKNLLKLQTKLLGSKESSACSSVLSSLESVESNTSEGNRSVEICNLNVPCPACESVTESLISSSCSSSLELRPPGHSKVSKIINKLQILSPISDKSQVTTVIIKNKAGWYWHVRSTHPRPLVEGRPRTRRVFRWRSRLRRPALPLQTIPTCQQGRNEMSTLILI